MDLTVLEIAMLKKIAMSEYSPVNGRVPEKVEDAQTWADMVIESRQDGGVVTSLQKKKLAVYDGEGRDAGIHLTDKGFALFHEILRMEAKAGVR